LAGCHSDPGSIPGASTTIACLIRLFLALVGCRTPWLTAPAAREIIAIAMRTRSAASLALLFAAIATAPSAHAAPTYTVVDIGVPDDSSDPSVVEVYGINNLGELTGRYRLANGESHAFLYTHGVVEDLGTLQTGKMSIGFAVNDASQVTGSSTLSDQSSNEHAFLHNGVFMADLGTLGGTISQGRGINSSGEVAGESTIDALFHRAFFFNGTFMENLGVVAGASSKATAINDAHMITGLSTSVAGPGHAFLYDGVEMHDIGTLGISVSEGRAINATGQIAGFSFPPGSFDQHAIFYDGAIMHDLGTLGGAKSFANGINDDGFVTGVSDIDESSVIHAFVWDGSMHDLNDLVVDLPPGVTIELQGSGQLGVVINRSGQIAASGRYLTGGPESATRGFLLTPVPEPAPSTSMASAALAAIAAARRRCVQPVS
jgi:probable HAF family extracellular repeat protein